MIVCYLYYFCKYCLSASLSLYLSLSLFLTSIISVFYLIVSLSPYLSVSFCVLLTFLSLFILFIACSIFPSVLCYISFFLFSFFIFIFFPSHYFFCFESNLKPKRKASSSFNTYSRRFYSLIYFSLLSLKWLF